MKRAQHEAYTNPSRYGPGAVMAKSRHRTSRSKRKRKGTRKAHEREVVLVVRPDVSLGAEDAASEGEPFEEVP